MDEEKRGSATRTRIGYWNWPRIRREINYYWDSNLSEDGESEV